MRGTIIDAGVSRLEEIVLLRGYLHELAPFFDYRCLWRRWHLYQAGKVVVLGLRDGLTLQLHALNRGGAELELLYWSCLILRRKVQRRRQGMPKRLQVLGRLLLDQRWLRVMRGCKILAPIRTGWTIPTPPLILSF